MEARFVLNFFDLKLLQAPLFLCLFAVALITTATATVVLSTPGFTATWAAVALLFRALALFARCSVVYFRLCRGL